MIGSLKVEPGVVAQVSALQLPAWHPQLLRVTTELVRIRPEPELNEIWFPNCVVWVASNASLTWLPGSGDRVLS